MIAQYENETALMLAFKKGEPAAETAMFHLVFKPFCLFAHEVVQNIATSEDIVAEH